ncbi:hypothetical protein [Aliiroseovarius lamellibrachiae]|uniref:hypothetical protein n=1 Tax=Aliiroseovarius lamellibrachiae TaxID=1924933 RepID=UPI001BE070AA|nr:hypothetical protein [Aliiroseovarius lamellibrachiae]MBT2130607.1 hypothetical protein [Aliiroseovarius lamellibrachiae]
MSKAKAIVLGFTLASVASVAMATSSAQPTKNTVVATSKTTYVCSPSGFGRKAKCYRRKS